MTPALPPLPTAYDGLDPDARAALLTGARQIHLDRILVRLETQTPPVSCTTMARVLAQALAAAGMAGVDPADRAVLERSAREMATASEVQAAQARIFGCLGAGPIPPAFKDAYVGGYHLALGLTDEEWEAAVTSAAGLIVGEALAATAAQPDWAPKVRALAAELARAAPTGLRMADCALAVLADRAAPEEDWLLAGSVLTKLAYTVRLAPLVFMAAFRSGILTFRTTDEAQPP